MKKRNTYLSLLSLIVLTLITILAITNDVNLLRKHHKEVIKPLWVYIKSVVENSKYAIYVSEVPKSSTYNHATLMPGTSFNQYSYLEREPYTFYIENVPGQGYQPPVGPFQPAFYIRAKRRDPNIYILEQGKSFALYVPSMVEVTLEEFGLQKKNPTHFQWTFYPDLNSKEVMIRNVRTGKCLYHYPAILKKPRYIGVADCVDKPEAKFTIVDLKLSNAYFY